jgi:uncharacterized membrane protein
MAQFSIQEALKAGWNIWKQNAWFLIGVTVVLFFLPSIPSYLANSPRVSGMLDTILVIIGWVLSLLMSIGMIKITLAFVDGVKAPWQELFRHYTYLVKYVVASILYGLIVAAGLVLFVIPGIYLALKYQFAIYLIVDKNLGIFEAFGRSGQMTIGVKWQLLGWFIVQTLLNIVGALLLGIGLLVTAPVTMLAYAKIYRDLGKTEPATPIL